MSVTNDLNAIESNSVAMDEFDVLHGHSIGVARFEKDVIRPTTYARFDANLESTEISKNKFEELIAQGAKDLTTIYDI